MSLRPLLITVLLAAAPACRDPARALPAPAASPRSTPLAGTLFSGRIPSDRPRSAGRGDIDGDGADDCWEARWEGGSGEGGVILEIRSPCGAPPRTLDTTSSFGEFLSPIALPPEIAARPRLVEGVVDLLFGRAHLRRVDSIDGSFRWLLERRLGPAGPVTPPFAETRRYTPAWSPGPPVIPPSQVVILSDPAYASLIEPRGPAVPGRPYGLVAYLAHNHGDLTPAITCGALAVLATRHGVAVHDRARDASSWIYVSTGVAKLRRPSLGRLACAGDMIAVERGQDGRNELVVVSPEAGRYGSIPLEGAYQLDEHGLTVGGETYSPDELAEALRRSSSP